MKLHRTFATLTTLFAPFGLGCDPGESQDPPTPADEAVLDSLGKPVGAISRAIIQSNPRAESSLLARVEVQPNELLEFYEPKPGALIVSGAGAPAGRPMLQGNGERDARLLWHKFAGGRPLPSSLEAAIYRSEQSGRHHSVDTGALPSSGGGSATMPGKFESQPFSKLEPPAGRPWTPRQAEPGVNAQAGWCDTGYYSDGWGACTGDPFLTWVICLDNHWNGAWAQHNDAAVNVTNVCPATGPVTLVMNNSDWNINPWYYDVPQNTVRWWNYNVANSCKAWWSDCPTIRADVVGAQGDRFHFRFRVEPE